MPVGKPEPDVRERFEFATEAAQIGFWFCDLPFDKLHWDARVKEHFWLPPEAEVDIQLFYRRLHPEDRERTRRAIEEAIETGGSYDVEYRTVSPDGTRQKWIRALGRTAYAEGVPIRFDGVTQDITPLKRAETELRETQRQLTLFADEIPALAWMADADGAVFWYNRRWYEYTGKTPEEMTGWGWRSVHHPDKLPEVMREWTRSIRTGEPFSMVFPLKSADGVFRSFLSRIVPMRNEQGKVVRWFGTNTEVEELQRTREALQQSEERVRVALENMPLILYTMDRELRYTWMYKPHPKMPLEQMLGKRDDELPTEMDLRDLMEFKRSVVASGIATRREFRFNVEGRTEVYDINAEPLRDAKGNIIGLTVAALDVTAVRLAEDALRKAEKLAVVGRLASSIAHEINNPLESVVNLLYLIRTSDNLEEMRAHTRAAEEELSRVSQIVTHALRFHRQSSAPTRERLSGLAESALALYKGRLQASDVTVVREYGDTPLVLCYPGELRQVLANLIGNAVDATAKGRIVLRIRESRDWKSGTSGVRVSVADTGHGIDSKTLEHLWEPFVTTKEVFGTGLGLWVSAEILARHHARVKVRSRAHRGRSGTVFSMLFPLETQPVAPTAGA